MAREGNYYLFQPPHSNTEHFVKVTDIKLDQQDQNRYVHYEHLLNDMEGSYEQSYFNHGSQQLTAESISNIIKNIGEEIEDLKSKMSDFNEVLKKIKRDKGELTNENGTTDEESSVKERNIERVEKE